MLQSMRSAAKYIWIILVIAFVGVFIFAETSGLSSRNVTRGTTIGRVNGQSITLDQYDRAVRALTEQRTQQGRTITLDEQRRLEQQAFDQIVDDILLQSELDRRGIEVTDREIQQVAQQVPLPEFMQLPELQTEGRFDPEKYQRYLRAAGAQQPGLFAYMEQRYRSELERQRLAAQLTAGVSISDAQLWRVWQDQNDSAKVTYVAFLPGADSAVKVTDAEIRRYFNEHREELEDRPGRAVVSLVMLPRPITAADSAATRARTVALREEIRGGAKFEDVARRESADSVSAARGGDLGRVTKGMFVEPFEKAAFALKPGELSEPVLSQFGYHLIRVDERKGDTLQVRHILLPIQQSDSSAAATDRRADQLARMAAESDVPARFDSAAKALGLEAGQAVAFEDQPLTWRSRYVPDVSAWAFGGAKPGETSPLIEADDAYYLARLDSLREGGEPTLELVRDEIRRVLARQKQVDALVPRAQKVAEAVAAGSTLEQAAQANGSRVDTTGMFTRVSGAPGLGRLNEAIGAAFALPVGAVSAPIKTRDGVYVLRVDRRAPADRDAWEKQKEQQRDQMLQAIREQRVQQFMRNLRETARIQDERRRIREAQQVAS